MENPLIKNNLIQTQQMYTDLNSLSQLKGDLKKNDPNAVRATVKQFESIFIDMVLKNLRDANAPFAEGNDMHTQSSNFYQDMFDRQLAVHIGQSEKGFGLTDTLMKQLNLNPEPEKKEQKPISSINLNPQPAIPTPLKAIASEIADKPQPLILKQSKPTFATPIDFVKSLWPHALAAAKQLNTDPKFLLAQAALETNWGKTIIRNSDGSSSHNLFGIKADSSWQKDRAMVTTLEYQSGIPKKQIAPFRSYDSYTESFLDYAKFLQENPRYQTALKKTDDPVAFAHELQNAGYATDPHYAHKIKQVLYSPTMIHALQQI